MPRTDAQPAKGRCNAAMAALKKLAPDIVTTTVMDALSLLERGGLGGHKILFSPLPNKIRSPRIWMAGIVTRVVSRALGPAVRRWSAFWSIADAANVAKDFRTAEEQQAWNEAANEHNARLKKDAIRRYAKESILPRVVLDEGAAIPRLEGRKERTGL
jgi:hypothetical protein